MPDFASLTPRERECLLALAELDDAKSVARRLGLSPHTVNNHLQSAMRKLEVRKSDRAARLYAAHVQGPGENSSGDVSSVDRPSPSRPVTSLRHGDDGRATGGRLEEERATFVFDRPADRHPASWPLRRRGETSNRLSPSQRLVWVLLIALMIGLLGLIVIATGSALTALDRQTLPKPPSPSTDRR